MTNQISKPCAEVIESSLGYWLSQSWKWNEAVPFGSLVVAETKHRTILGIVYQIQTGSIDPQRYPFPYQKTQEELLKEQPQIFEFLKTTFSCVTIGYLERERIHYQLAPQPPHIHSFVGPATTSLARQCFARDIYLQGLFAAAALVGNVDELLLAVLNYQESLQILDPKKIGSLMQTYSLLTGNDYRRIKLFLQRVEPIIHS